MGILLRPRMPGQHGPRCRVNMAREQEAESTEQKAQSREQGEKSRNQGIGAQSREQGPGSKKQGSRSKEHRAESKQQGAKICFLIEYAIVLSSESTLCMIKFNCLCNCHPCI